MTEQRWTCASWRHLTSAEPCGCGKRRTSRGRSTPAPAPQGVDDSDADERELDRRTTAANGGAKLPPLPAIVSSSATFSLASKLAAASAKNGTTAPIAARRRQSCTRGGGYVGWCARFVVHAPYLARPLARTGGKHRYAPPPIGQVVWHAPRRAGTARLQRPQTACRTEGRRAR